MMFRIAAVTTFLAAISASSKISMAKADTECTLCYDYSDFTFDLAPKECTEISLLRKIKDHHKAKRKETGQKCKSIKNTSCDNGGLNRELMALTNTNDIEEARGALQDLCDAALAAAAAEADSGNWGSLEGEGIGMDDFFDGQGFLNLETGNFKQSPEKFKGGGENYIYIGTDPRKNDHYATTEESYQAGQAIMNFYNDEAKNSFISSPTTNFGKENDNQACAQTNAAVCCWHRDRQYLDANGNCGPKDCANQNPGDNTDLCWTEQDGEIFPYPGAGTEQDLHCHGFAWGMDSDETDVNRHAKWNNLFYVSLYDHLYTRGYAESVTNDPNIAGTQAMCGCVEDMNPIARADCTEAVGRANTTLAVSGEGKLSVKHVTDSFQLEFKACEGYDYVADFGPEEYQIDPNAAELEASNNDLAAFMYRLYLEGKIDEGHTEAFAETIIGYSDPSVNDSDNKREAACEAAFNDRFPGEKYDEKEIVA